MYKWPQGRVIRTVCLLLTLMVVADLAYNGVWANFGAGETTSQNKQLILGALFAVLCLVALVAGLVAAGFHPKAVDFLIEVELEMTKVEWPKGAGLVRSTLIIAIAIAIMAALIFAVDIVNFNFINKWWPWVYDWLSGTH
jgi:preprotein translocase SecE subunit